MNGEKIIRMENEYTADTYSRFPVALTSGTGSLAYDADGNEYIDMGSGIAVNTFGISDEKWISAVSAQLGKIQHTSNLYYSAPCAELSKLLCTRTGAEKVFYSNSGAEANETAIKAARKYAENKKGAGYYNIITLTRSFHGRTLAALAATGQEALHRDFLPLMPGFLYAEPGDIEGVRKLTEENGVAAIMFECVQGEGGVSALGKEFVSGLASLAAEKDILLICDEVQCGNGRSGALYAYMNYGISPDIVTTAKGLGGGLPIGATMLFEKTAGVFTPGTHGSTFGGNPAVCAGALSVISRIDDKLLSEVRIKSKLVFDCLTDAKGIKSVSGMGLMIGVETEKPADTVVSECIENGVLTLKAKTKLRLLPALNIPEKLLLRALEIIKAACA